MTSYLYRAPAGTVGDISRPDETTVEPGLLNPAKAPASFGAPVKIVSGAFEAIEASDAASVFYGILSRVAPSIAGDTAQTLASGTPNTAAVQGIVRAGYVNVACAQGTPVRGGQVFMRVTAATGKLVGDFETTADSGACVALSGVTWAVDGKDASNTAEIRIA